MENIIMSKYLRYMTVLFSLALIAAGIWFYFTYYEGEKPSVEVGETLTLIGLEKSIDVVCTDNRSGLRTITTAIIQDGKRHVLDIVNIPVKGVARRKINIAIDSRSLQLHDGKAVFEVQAIDYSLRNNKGILSAAVTVDTTPPTIYQITPAHYINPGGSCVTLYRSSEELRTTYVFVNDDHYQAYPTTISGKSCYISYFATSTDTTRKTTRIGIVAEDRAGNSVVLAVPYHLRKKRFRNRPMNISDAFLERKIPEFRQMNTSIPGTTLVEAFVYINETLRQENLETVKNICAKTSDHQLWSGAFLRMKNAATMALFGDRRTYLYKGKQISKSIHVGIDLASTKNATIHAANNGRVAFAGNLGIYGNCIILDHGLGVFSFYAHLGMMNVSQGQQVEKGVPIGRSDTSGLAGGDHLHFGIFVGTRFVNPREWWDPHWIRDNVERKLNVTF